MFLSVEVLCAPNCANSKSLRFASEKKKKDVLIRFLVMVLKEVLLDRFLNMILILVVSCCLMGCGNNFLSKKIDGSLDFEYSSAVRLHDLILILKEVNSKQETVIFLINRMIHEELMWIDVHRTYYEQPSAARFRGWVCLSVVHILKKKSSNLYSDTNIAFAKDIEQGLCASHYTQVPDPL